MNAPTRLHASWYLLALVPLTIGILVAIKLASALFDDVKRMDRVIVPGERELELTPGEYVLYAETRSVVDGVTYLAASVQLRCAMVDRDGAPVELDSPIGSATYRVGGFAGKSFAKATIPSAGVYRLACTGGPAVVALGGGFGTRLVAVFITAFGGFVLALVTVLRVRRRRRRKPAAAVTWPHL